jgi:hypothetical protein
MSGLVAAVHTGSIEWSILHTLNDFVGILVLVFLFADGERRRVWRPATVAAVLSAGVACLPCRGSRVRISSAASPKPRSRARIRLFGVRRVGLGSAASGPRIGPTAR